MIAASTEEHLDGRLVVASVPSDHPYIRHLGPENGGGPAAADRPGSGRPESQRATAVVAARRCWTRTGCEGHDFDLLHVHFGFDARTPRDLAQFVAALRARLKPLVFTVHDLRNPHHADPADQHDAQLDVLVSAADALITLTPGAAAEIRRRWGREARVIPHPHVVDFRTMEVARRARRPAGDRPVPGRSARQERARQHGPGAVLPVLVETVHALPGAPCCRSTRTTSSSSRHGRSHDRRGWSGAVAQSGAPRRPAGPRLPRRRLAFFALPRLARRLRAALPLRHPLGLARGVPRPRHHGDRADVRLLRRAGPGARATSWTRTASTPIAHRRGDHGLRRPTGLRRHGCRAPPQRAAIAAPTMWLYRSVMEAR